ncbi:MAG TPA: hypothetical protein VGJ00_08570 [Rhabdochlamydiaceae bacterium]|jgi:hypothetical protein
MRFLYSPNQREFFYKNRFIEFEELLSKDQVAQLNKEIDELMAMRLHISLTQVEKMPSLTLFRAGHDLWRNAPGIRNATQKLSFAQIASELFGASPLRIAFDQYFCIYPPCDPFFNKAFSLNEISCIKPLAGAILFLLEDLSQPLPPLPHAAGNVLFISPELHLPWDTLFQAPRLRFLLVAFAPEKSFYRHEPNDYHCPALKKWGYVYNDKLQQSLHPFVYGKK